MHSNLIAPHLQVFFAEYLCQQKRQSPKTIISCRDTFRLLLTFVRDQTGVEPSALRIADVDAPVVLRFLTYLEQERGNSVRSRNIRLSAIRSFFRLVALRDPDSLGIVTRVLAIPMKREDRKLIAYLTRTEMQALLAAPDRSKWSGRRDYALLLTLYNSGARVSEVTALKRTQVYLALQEGTCDITPFSLSHCHVDSYCLARSQGEISAVARNRQLFRLLKPKDTNLGPFS